MAKRAAGTGKSSGSSSGRALVIVESPAKARTIAKYLGKDYTVEASIGHIRDLPKGTKELPEEFKRKKWSYLGVNVDADFEPVYIVPGEKKAQVAKLKSLLKDASRLYLATDEDREGEAISWHLLEVLKPRIPVHRLVFHEITEEAILDALEHPRDIDDGLVRAQETRRILDRLYGYEVSQLLWRKVAAGLSAGRVQSVAVRLIVERERQRIAFRSATYWDLIARFVTEDGKEFDAELVSVGGRKVPAGKDFDPSTGKIRDPKLLLLDEKAVKELAENLQQAKFAVHSLDDKPYTRKPSEPFTTSTLQQEANRKLGFTARRTMNVAQSLYENGYITYMRTDSTNLAQVAIDAARDLVRTEYGNHFLPAEPRVYKSKVKNAQEAHEAIRPAGHPFKLPESLRNVLTPDQFRLFDLIWKRTIASQMLDARGRSITLQVAGSEAVFQVTGKTIEFPGFLRAYVEGSDDPEAELADQERLLPSVNIGDPLGCKNLNEKSHSTQPPARFSEAALTAALEERGIGRPSTYASIIDTILERKYVFKKANALVPTWVAFSVSRLMETHLPNLVNYEFTAKMEDLLDSISRKEEDSVTYLKSFYFGDDQVADSGLKAQLDKKIIEVDPREMGRFTLGTPTEGEHKEEVFVRVGKYGPFIEQGERKGSIPQDTPPDEMTLERALQLLDQAGVGDEPLGICPDTHLPVYLKQGRFGPYVQRGSADENEKPKNASLLPGMQPGDVTFVVALDLLKLPRSLGEHPETKEPILSANGRYGPYIKHGSDFRSLPPTISPVLVTLEEALAIFAQPKVRGRRGQAKEPLKTFEASPQTGQPIRVLEGRYGVYITDGETNATLPKDLSPEQLTLPQAITLLEERAAMGPPKKGRRGAKKASTPKKTAEPKAPKAAKKKVAPKKKAATKKTAKKSSNGENGEKKPPARKTPKKIEDVPF